MEPVRVGHYAIGEAIGRGAVGEVRAAFDVVDGQPVAIKLLTAEVARQAGSGAIFAREVRAVARLDHVNVVTIHDQGVLGAEAADALGLPPGSPWFSMERAEGSAQQPIRSWIGLRELLLALLEGLAHCHARGLVHRDLKPGNVLRVGSVWKLADFGLAVSTHDPGNRVSGTPLYMAPEQFLHPDQVGPWTDLYAVGCVAWARATGYPPFLGDHRALQQAHTTGDFPPFETQFPLPKRFGLWLRRLLTLDPARRIAHAWDARAALLALEPESPPPLSAKPPRAHAGPGLIGLRELPLIGRDAEARTLRTALEATLDAHAQRMMIVEGVAGCGKTHLARSVCVEAAERGLVETLEVHNAREEGGLSALAARVLRRPRIALESADRAVLEAWVDFHSPTPPLDDRVAALIGALDTIGRHRPLALLLDDLQWDVESQMLASRLLQARGEPLFILGTERLEPGRGSVLDPSLARMRLTALSHDDAESLAAAVLGVDGMRAIQLAEISRGSPLLAVQLAVHFARTGKFAVQSDPTRAWGARLDAVVAHHPALWDPLRVAATLGARVSWREWHTLRGDTTISPLVRAVLAEETAHGWQLVHPLLADAVRERTPPQLWASLCEQAGDRLVDADPLRRAQLLGDGGAHDTACTLALSTHSEALNRGDWGRARRACALAVANRTANHEVAVEVAELRQAWIEDPDASLERRAGLLFHAHPEVDTGLLYGRLLTTSSDPNRALEPLDYVLQVCPEEVRAYQLMCTVHRRCGRFDEVARCLDAIGALELEDPWLQTDLIRRRGQLAYLRGELALAASAYDEALEVALSHGLPSRANHARYGIAEVARFRGDLSRAEDLLREVLQHDRRFGSLHTAATLNLGLVLLEQDHPARAQAMLDPLRVHADPDIRTLARLGVARAHATLGDLERIPDLLEGLQPLHEPDMRRQLEALKELLAYEPELEALVDDVLAQLS